MLIERGADVNFQARVRISVIFILLFSPVFEALYFRPSLQNHIQPLHVASKWGKSNMVVLLLDHGAQLESHTRDGLTPLHCAARSGQDQVVDLLLERGADVQSKTKVIVAKKSWMQEIKIYAHW